MRLSATNKITLFLCLLISVTITVCQSVLAKSSETALLVPGKSHIQVTEHIEFYEDKNHDFSVDRMIKNPPDFSPAPNRAINFGMSRSKFWLRLAVKNTGTGFGEWQMATGVLRMNSLKIYQVEQQQATLIFENTIHSPFSARQIPNRFLFSKLQLEPQQQSLLLFELFSEGPIIIPLRILDNKTAQHNANLDLAINAFIVGIFFSLALFNLFQYFAVKRNAYLFYILLALSNVFNIFQLMGYNFQYFWPNDPNFNQNMVPVAMSLTMIFSLLFTHSFLNVPKLNTTLNRLFMLTMFLYVIPLVSLTFFDYQTTIKALSICVLPTIFILLFTGIYACYKKVLSANFYLAGWLFYLSGLVYLNLNAHGLQGLPINGLDVGKYTALFEAIIFSMALAHQMRYLRQQHDASQKQLIDSLAETAKVNKELAISEQEKYRALLDTQKKSEHLASTSHDFSQPIQSLRMSLQVIKMDNNNTEATDNIEKTLEYLQALSSSLVTQAKLEASEQKETIVINELFNEIFNRYANLAEEKQLGFYFKFSKVAIQAPPTSIRRILDNLVNNALRYTKNGKVFFGLRRRREGIEIQVVDSGPGIPTEKIEALLEPFQQGQKNTDKENGFGLGLHVVKSLCDELGYQLNIHSTPGKGSLFSVLIPQR